MKKVNSGEKILHKEESFHDDWAASVDIDRVAVDEFFEACTAPENRYIMQKLGDLNGKRILEVGCGLGEASVYFAKKGADVVATDISSGMLEVVKKLAALHNVSLTTKQAYSHELDFVDNSFDVVYAANLLHHIDLEPTLKEVKRVLKKGGVFISWDPLAHNPMINVYRKMAMKVRTDDEHPIQMKQLKIFKQFFSKIDIKTTWFFTLWIFLKFYFIDRVDPNKERYWKKIITDHKKLEKMYYRLEKIDNLFLKLFPFMRRFCWNIVVIGEK
ncbi:class I SAM-dependent methyltransferase [bacterium]|jgi:ubiquinone/menaquinone biosynthesis C-methylase UbiE|nr:class I SAM-dependent methyltransferase [bacterium]MBT3581959.1 class I SAM-dependent methyltransferase [bacterium]MBT4551688.1 class I SAM-dependent methyltransferase [bacterium]MBT7088513.1 class I SAM-dependent methyltransferase [bacterium]